MTEMSSYEPGVPSWVDLATTDPEAARAFYGALFGWHFDMAPAENGYYTMCRVGGAAVAGMNGTAVTQMPPAWITYVATDDSEAVAARISAAGGRIVMGPVDAGTAGRVVLAFDPQGTLFGTWEPGEHLGAGLVDVPGAVVWNELVTTDLASAQEFYTRVFGYDWDVTDAGGSEPPYQTMRLDGRLVAGARQVPAGAAGAPQWLPYFGVTDAGTAASSVAQQRGTVQVPPADSPFGLLAVLTDPQGATFSVIEQSGGD